MTATMLNGRHTPLHERIQSGQIGWPGAPIRGALRLAEFFYCGAVAFRNRQYDRGGRITRLSVPVISVGNITVGGTGKTPFVMEVIRRLQLRSRRPAVVSRGYKSAGGEPNDEERVIRRHCPEVPVIADPDRASGGRLACEKFGANVIVLDDGFQHRRLARDLDIVLVDTTRPFGFDHVLPRGLLREPLEGLRRADLLVLTRCEQASADELRRIEDRLRGFAPGVPIIRCTHSVRGIESLGGVPLEDELRGRRVMVFAGIARPEAFLRTVRGLGAEVVGECWWSDHHHYQALDIARVARLRSDIQADFLAITEKDAVKLGNLSGVDRDRVAVIRVGIEFLDEGGDVLDEMLAKLP